MSPHRDWFDESSFTTLTRPILIHLGDAMVIEASGRGSLCYQMDVNGKLIKAKIPDALYVPELAATLISVSHLTQQDHKVEFNGPNYRIVYKLTLRAVADAVKTPGGLYRLKGKPLTSTVNANLIGASRIVDINLLHRRLGHLSIDNVKRLVDKGLVEGVDAVRGNVDFCEPCVKGKQHHLPFPKSGKRARNKLDLVHSDLCGPFPTSLGGKNYFITFIDDNTHHLFLYFLQRKSDAFTCFNEFKSMVETESGCKIRRLRTDNGIEYIDHRFQAFLRSSRIFHETTAPDTPEQNR
jgi:GAG-pre-integrase domain/Integrase core domain/Pol polyprotein, beta-barrel domain